MATTVENGERYCAACAFRDEEYNHTGDQIVRSDAVDVDDERLVFILTDSMSAQELRGWMSAHDITRPRGATKKESVEAALEQDRIRVEAYADNVEGIADRDPATAMCSCGYEQRFPSEERAIVAAEQHAEETGHEPKAWADDGRRLHG